jgi:hypothetical protein
MKTLLCMLFHRRWEMVMSYGKFGAFLIRRCARCGRVKYLEE